MWGFGHAEIRRTKITNAARAEGKTSNQRIFHG